MRGGKRKSALFFLLLAINILLTPSFNVGRDFTVSAASNSNPVNLLKANVLWERTAGGEGFDMPTCITVLSYQGYVVGGFTFSFGNGERDFWLFKVDDSGNLPWSCTVGRSEFEEAYTVLEVAENEFVMAGWTNPIGQGHYDFYVTKVSVENDGEWLSAYNFIVLALITTAIVLVVLVILFFLVRRYVNQKISRQDMNAVLKHDA